MKKDMVMEEKDMVTPKEIKDIEFGKGIKGYKEHEVDVFLDKVRETIEYLLQENLKLEETVKSQGAIIEKQTKDLEVYLTMENTLKTTLITAQASATETCESANKKALEIIEEATMKADSMIKTAEASATETCESANKNAFVTIEEANMKADNMIKTAEKKVESIKKEYEELSNRYNTFRGNYIAMLEKEMKAMGSYTFEQENSSNIAE